MYRLKISKELLSIFSISEPLLLTNLVRSTISLSVSCALWRSFISKGEKFIDLERPSSITNHFPGLWTFLISLKVLKNSLHCTIMLLFLAFSSNSLNESTIITRKSKKTSPLLQILRLLPIQHILYFTCVNLNSIFK